MRTQKGSITVMLLLVLCALLTAVALIVETARIKIAENQAQRALDTALFSALASFDQDTKDEYGLFFRYGSKGLEQEIQEALGKTLLIDDDSEAWSPYGYQVKSLKVRTLFPLNEKDAIEHQIVEYMKYRGPVELVGDVMEKMGAFFSMQATATVMKADMAVDKKIKRLAEQIQALEALMPRVTGYTDAELSNFNGYARSVAEKAMQLETLQDEADALDPLEDAEEIAYIWDRIDALRENMTDAGEGLLEEIVPVLTANRQALEICRELKRLAPEIEAAIGKAEAAVAQEEHADPTIRKDLKDKYAAYRKYCSTEFLEGAEEDLESNVALLEPKVELMEYLLGGGTSGYNPPVFTQRGYRSVSFEAPEYPRPAVTGQSPEVTLTPAGIARLLETVKTAIREIKTSIWVEDKGPVLLCPGNKRTAPVADAKESARTGYDGANDTLSSLYDSVGKTVDADPLMDTLAQGVFDASDRMYDALLVNEYVLETFNCRDEGERETHALQQTEVEYVLVGSADPQVNASVSQLEIIAWRTVFNAVSFTCYCPEIIRQIDAASAGLNGLTGVPYPVWKGVITGLLSFIESYADTKRMIEGDSVPIYKFRLSETSVAAECRELFKASGMQIPDKNPAAKTPAQGLMVDYEDHLRAMLLYRSLLGQQETTLGRIQDLIFTNIRQARGEYDPSKHYSFIEADAQVTIKSFFPNLSGIRLQTDGIPLRYTITVKSGRGY